MLSYTKNKAKIIEGGPRIIQLGQQPTFNYNHHKRLVLTANGSRHVIPHSEVAYVKSDGNYCEFHLLEGRRIIVSKILKHFEAELDETFARVHQSYIVNLLQIKQYNFKTATITLLNDMEISVSRSYRNSVIKLIS